MNLYTLENDLIRITAHEQGGELHSITSKKTGLEYLWSGDPKHWKYHAPVLFPTIGKVINGEYRAAGGTYKLPQHGLARLRAFTEAGVTKSAVTFSLQADKDTLAVYPYRFNLFITYRLTGNKVSTEYVVENTDNKEIFFSIGGHPAYMCPLKAGCKFDDYYFEFERAETLTRMMLNEAGYFSHETTPYLKNEQIIPISHELFKDDAIVVKPQKSKSISVKSKKHKEYMTFYFNNFPYLGLWSPSPAEPAPFVCIEPWFGHADFMDFTGDISQKAGIVSLKAGQSFQASYDIAIFE